MAEIEKAAERDRKARAYREFVRSLAVISKVYEPTASSIFDSLSRAHLHEQHAESTRLARETLFAENPEVGLPEELSDKTISQYLASAGDLYGNAATDYVLISDPVRAYKYFGKAAQHYRGAADLATENGYELLEKAQEYQGKAALVRQQLAKRSILRR